MKSRAADRCLLVRAGLQLCALPLASVEETMRPLEVRPVAGLPSFVRGLAVVRGVPVPVVDAACVLGQGETSAEATRFVTLAIADRRVALAVDQVLGVRPIDTSRFAALPPLLGTAADDVISAIGTLDSELLLVLRSGRLVPEEAWNAIDVGETA